MAANGGIKGKLNKPSHGGDAVTTMTASGNLTVQQGTTEVDVLVVAGGGAGGHGNVGGGGGGAGGLQNLTTQSVNSANDIAITVGGGASGAGSNAVSADGSDSVFSNPSNPITSTGGGGGGSTPAPAGRAGGSGGGSYDSGSAGAGTPGQGNNGGGSSGSSPQYYGGGGGGAGSAGVSGATPENRGNGGDGAPSTITGTATYFAGGGSGSVNDSTNPLVAVGGGGKGGGGSDDTNGTSGTTNTGGGGGGGGDTAGSGGSGIVIVKEKDKASGVWNSRSQYSSKLKGQWPDPNQYEITNSCKFNGSDDQLQRTPSSAGNKKTFTWSAWVKRCGEDSDFFIGGGTSGSVYVGIGFQSDQLKYYDQSSGVLANKQTNAKFRDPAAWYHIVAEVDTTQATANERIKLYVNGKQQTSFTTDVIPSQNQDLYFGQANIISIGTIHYTAGNTDYHNGYVSDVYFIDGLALHCGNFGEPDPDNPTIWRPKKYEGIFGGNGFKLEFKQTGTSANASGIGADTSGNGNHFSVVNLTSIDTVADTPTNNFATWNPLQERPGEGLGTFSEGNTKVTGSSKHGYATIALPTSGKWYAEVKFTSGSSTAHLGLRDIDDYTADGNTDRLLFRNDANYDDGDHTNLTSYGSSWTNSIIGIAVNLDDNEVVFYKDGTAQNSGTAISHNASNQFIHAATAGSYTAEANFGNPPFSISSGNADANGYGTFEYAVPSGYYSLCTKNLAQYG
jgi:hypothetical protein